MSSKPVAMFDPAGKPFKQRLAAFLQYVQNRYGIHISQDLGRTPQWAQTMHVCHMFLYNAFNNATPKHTEDDDDTISWNHMSDAKVVWDTVKFTHILRTTDGRPPVKDTVGWKKGSEPDLEQSKLRAKQVMIEGGCANGGTSMIACGFKPCGEPCGCRVGVSKHISGLAADLRRQDLHQLQAQLKKNNAGSLDSLLDAFGLHRPMLHHRRSPEEWHVESKSDHHVSHKLPAIHHQAHHERLAAANLLEQCPHAQK